MKRLSDANFNWSWCWQKSGVRDWNRSKDRPMSYGFHVRFNSELADSTGSLQWWLSEAEHAFLSVPQSSSTHGVFRSNSNSNSDKSEMLSIGCSSFFKWRDHLDIMWQEICRSVRVLRDVPLHTSFYRPRATDTRCHLYAATILCCSVVGMNRWLSAETLTSTTTWVTMGIPCASEFLQSFGSEEAVC